MSKTVDFKKSIHGLNEQDIQARINEDELRLKKLEFAHAISCCRCFSHCLAFCQSGYAPNCFFFNSVFKRANSLRKLLMLIGFSNGEIA